MEQSNSNNLPGRVPLAGNPLVCRTAGASAPSYTGGPTIALLGVGNEEMSREENGNVQGGEICLVEEREKSEIRDSMSQAICLYDNDMELTGASDSESWPRQLRSSTTRGRAKQAKNIGKKRRLNPGSSSESDAVESKTASTQGTSRKAEFLKPRVVDSGEDAIQEMARTATLARASLGISTSADTATLKQQVSDDVDVILQVASKSKNLKGTARTTKTMWVLDIRRMRVEMKDEDLERTPKRAKRVAIVEDKGTNTSTGGEMEGLEWDDDLGTETEWKEVKAKKKGRRRKENKIPVATNSKPKRELEKKEEKNEKNIEKGIPGGSKGNKANTQAPERKSKRNTEEKKPVRKKPMGKKPTAKPEALLVEVKDRDYASVLKEVKSGLAKEEIVFSRVRKTRRGDILLELEKGQTGGASIMKEKVGEIYPSLTLRTLKESSDVIIKGLDITVEKEEVDEVLRQKVKDFRIKSFWENNYGIKTAIIELPKEEAQKLLDEKKIKIGWMRVPVRLLAEKKKCYRCLEYGHISTGCPGQDRSKKCFNCGNEGHKAKECMNETTCAICKDKGQARSNHRIGSKNCPSWKEKVRGIQNVKSKNGI